MKRLILVSGGYDLLNALSYIRSDVAPLCKSTIVLLYSVGNVPHSLRESVQAMCAQSTEIDDFSYKKIASNNRSDRLSFANALKKTFLNDDVELLTFRIFGKLEKELIKTIDPSRLVLVENGIATYLPPVSRMPWSVNRIERQLAKQVNVAWLPLHLRFGVPFYLSKQVVHSPELNVYKNLCSDLAKKLKCEIHKDASKKSLVFVIGTSYYRLGHISEEDEAACYRLFCENAIERGAQVIWKPHPRLNSKLNWVGDMCDKEIQNPYPQELFLSSLAGNNVEVASIASTSLSVSEIYFNAKPILISSKVTKEIESKLSHVKLMRQKYI